MSEYERLKQQKDEIVARQRTSETELWHHWHERWQEVSKELNKQKSITELAVKGLQESKIAFKWAVEYHINTCTCPECNALGTIEFTLSEIERLKNELLS
jgi:hypothetical protein